VWPLAGRKLSMSLDPQRTLDALKIMTDPVAFERLCAEVLATCGEYAGLIPQGVGRRDGGKDAIGLILGTRRDEQGDSVSWLTEGQVFHFSLREDVETKVRQDLATTQKHGLQPVGVVFVTSRRCTPETQDRLKQHCRVNYGWELVILDQEWLRLHLDTAWQSVRKRYLGIDYDLPVFQDINDLLERTRHSINLQDLEHSAYFRRERFHAALIRHLDQHRAALLVGQPGSGKTALAHALGWEWCQKDTRRAAFYLSARKNGDWRLWAQAIHAFDSPYACYIIDDAHLEVEAVSLFLERWGEFHHANLLIISRPLEPSLRGSDDSYFEILQQQTVSLESTADDWSDIVLALTAGKSGEIGDIQRLLTRCAGDLHLLRIQIEAWLLSSEPIALAEVSDDTMDEALVRHYLDRNRQDEAMLALTALGQYEIPVECAWLRGLIGHKRVFDESWCSVFTLTLYGRKAEYAQFFHSTPARRLLQAASRRGRLKRRRTPEEHTLACLQEYQEIRPLNAARLFHMLYLNGGATLQHQLFADNIMESVLTDLPVERWDGLADAVMLLYSLWRSEGSPEAGEAHRHWRRIRERLGSHLPMPSVETGGFPSVASATSYLAKLDDEFQQEILAVLDYADLGRMVREVGLTTVRNFLDTASRAGVEKNLLRDFCSGLNFAELGNRSREVGLATVKNFLDTASRAGVEKNFLRDFCSGLNFAELGNRSREVGLATVRTFLDTASRAGVKKSFLRDFCSGLNFAELGNRSREVGLATVKIFLDTASRAGVEKNFLRDFCSGLNFAELGRQSREVGLATVNNFLDTASRAGVDHEQLKRFCQELDFRRLGQTTQGAPLTTVMIFMQEASLVGVSGEKLRRFAEGLDWHVLGAAMRLGEDGKHRAYLPVLLWLNQNRGIVRMQARAFVESWGWLSIRDMVEHWLSPDGLAALLELLQTRCGYTPEQLRRIGLNPQDAKLWILAFKEHLAGNILVRYQQHCLQTALAQFKAALCTREWSWRSLNLKQWSILSHNLTLADPSSLDSLIWPALSALTPEHFARLISQSNVRDLSFFVNRFQLGGLFQNRVLPTFRPEVGTLAGLRAEALSDWAHLLLNLWWVGAGEAATNLMQLWRDEDENLRELIMQTDARGLSFFLWAAYLAEPAGDWWLTTGMLHEAVMARLHTLDSENQGEPLHWLGIAGIFALAGQNWPLSPKALNLSATEAQKQVRTTFDSLDSELIRCLAGIRHCFGDTAAPDFKCQSNKALTALPPMPQPAAEKARMKVLGYFNL